MQAHPKRRRAIVGVVAEGFPTRKSVAGTDAGRPGPKSLSRWRVDFGTGMSQNLAPQQNLWVDSGSGRAPST